jgi:hypothetical protein
MLSACLLQLQNGQCLFRVLGNGVTSWNFLPKSFSFRDTAIPVEFDFIDPITRPDRIDELCFHRCTKSGRPAAAAERVFHG